MLAGARSGELGDVEALALLVHRDARMPTMKSTM